LGNSHLILGMVLMNTGKPAEAKAELRRAMAINQKLVDDSPTLTESRIWLGEIHKQLSIMLMNAGRLSEAEAECRRALAILPILADVVAADQGDTADIHAHIGDVLSLEGKPEEALEAQRKALAIRQKRAEAKTADIRCQAELAKSHLAIGRLHAREKRFAEAFAVLDSGLSLCQKLADADPKSTEYARQLGIGHAIRCWTRVRAGQSALAAADLRRALELWAKTPHLDIQTRFERGRVLALLAAFGKDPESGVTAAQAAAFADRSIEALREAFAYGWNLPDELREPDYDAIRDRADFNALVTELESKRATKK
jgi:tetratricopeptide (TPR) repeat protein